MQFARPRQCRKFQRAARVAIFIWERRVRRAWVIALVSVAAVLASSCRNVRGVRLDTSTARDVKPRMATVLDDGRSLRPQDEYFTYKIGEHDKLSVSVEVAGQLEYAGSLEVDWTGRVKIPTTDTVIRVSGHTQQQAESAVAEALAPYYKVTPDVTVELAESQSRRFWAVGNTTVQGSIAMGLKELRLRDALEKAGFKMNPVELNRAYGKMVVITPDVEKPTYVVVNARHVMFGELRDNIRIKPGDIIYVPSTLFANLNKIMNGVLQQAETSAELYRLLKDMEDGRYWEDGRYRRR